MRIIAGQQRGLVLADVGKGDAAAHLRPTSDRVRESLFSMILGGRYGNPITGARVLDLFAGTGALGLEALSRGAAHVTFVDTGLVAQKLIHANIAITKRQADTQLLTCDSAQLPTTDQPFDLIFLDPPYGKRLGLKALTAAKSAGWIAPGALIILEENAAQLAPLGFATRDQRRYGDTWITLMEPTP